MVMFYDCNLWRSFFLDSNRPWRMVMFYDCNLWLILSLDDLYRNRLRMPWRDRDSCRRQRLFLFNNRRHRPAFNNRRRLALNNRRHRPAFNNRRHRPAFDDRRRLVGRLRLARHFRRVFLVHRRLEAFYRFRRRLAARQDERLQSAHVEYFKYRHCRRE